MGKGGSAKTEVMEYYMSIHEGLGHGPFDAILGIIIGEKVAWAGEVTESGPIAINAPEIFGGVKKEGGARGVAYYLSGAPNQVLPESLAARLGYTSETCPAFRGLATLFFVGADPVTGSVSLPGDTGGTGGVVTGGTGGGGYSGGGGSYCVAEDSWFPNGKQGFDLGRSDHLLILDPDDFSRVISGTVIRSIVSPSQPEPCVEIESASGIRLVVSTSTPLTLRCGSTINVRAGFGHDVPVFDGNGFRWEAIRDIRMTESRRVVHIDARDSTFAAGAEQGRYILTHNMAKSSEEILP